MAISPASTSETLRASKPPMTTPTAAKVKLITVIRCPTASRDSCLTERYSASIASTNSDLSELSGSPGARALSLAEGEGIRLDSGSKAEFEEALPELRPREERVEPVAGHAHHADGAAVEEDADGAAPAEDEVDVVRVEVEPQPRVAPGHDPLAADEPRPAVRELV